MAWRAFPWIGLAALVMLLTACADRSVQTAAGDRAVRASTGCVALRPPPPFTSARGQTASTRTDLMTRC